jgi:uncharacterized membrane protein YphA (DoxX/SURF4 family)
MSAVVLVVRGALAAVFAVAGVAKLRDPQGAQRTVGGVGVPAGLRPLVATILSAVELGVSALLVLPGLGLIGAFAALLMLSVFLVALGVQYLRGVEVPCACFGQLAVTPAGMPTLIRNLVLAGSALFLLVALR